MQEKGRSSGDELPKYLEESEANKVIEKAKDHKKRDHLVLLTLFRSGIRVGELVELEKRDIREDRGELLIRRGKGGKDRVVPLERELGILLSYYTDDLGKYDKAFDISTRTVRNIVKRHAADLDLSLPLEKISSHTFRHSYAVKVLRDGMNIRSLQKALGHKDLATTMIYLDIIAQDVKDDFEESTEW